jgi:hypothetical protein
LKVTSSAHEGDERPAIATNPKATNATPFTEVMSDSSRVDRRCPLRAFRRDEPKVRPEGGSEHLGLEGAMMVEGLDV